MTNRKIKEELKHVYQPPVPQRKNDFLRDAREPSSIDMYRQLSMPDFLLIQVQYIPFWVWVVSGIVFFSSLYAMNGLGEEARWTISALIPFVSASVVAAIHRSVYYQVDELEQATRFSLKTITYARLCILGIENLVLLLVLSPLMVYMCEISLIEVIACLLCPYTMTAAFSLYVLRVWHSDENIFACVGISVGVSLVCFFYKTFNLAAVSDSIYLLMGLVLLVLMVREYKQYFIYVEELRWN